MKRVVLLSASLAAALACSGGAAAENKVMRVSHQLPPAHHIAKLMETWAADVEGRSGGTIDLQILGADQAFKPNENFPAVAQGQIEAALSVNFQWGNTIPEMNVTLIPYAFTELDAIEKFPGSEAAKLLEGKLEEKGVRNLAWLFTTRQSIFTSSGKALIAPADFEGIKIRGLNKLVDNALIAVGAAPAAMPGSEVYQALQTQVIDAGLTDVSAAYSRKYYEVQEFGTVTPFFTVYFHLYGNPAWLDGLDAEQREAVMSASAKAEVDSIPLTEQTADEALGQLKEKGMKVHVHSAAEAKAFADVMRPPVEKAFLEASPDDGARLIDMLGKL
ncbi:MAG: TRAP transporter substrate-binding protein DctP [Kiloniellales bacterium]